MSADGSTRRTLAKTIEDIDVALFSTVALGAGRESDTASVPDAVVLSLLSPVLRSFGETAGWDPDERYTLTVDRTGPVARVGDRAVVTLTAESARAASFVVTVAGVVWARGHVRR